MIVRDRLVLSLGLGCVPHQGHFDQPEIGLAARLVARDLEAAVGLDCILQPEKGGLYLRVVLITLERDQQRGGEAGREVFGKHVIALADQEAGRHVLGSAVAELQAEGRDDERH